MKQLDTDYIARYEYACSLIARFFERELLVDKMSKEDHLFDTNSIPQILFSSDYSKLVLSSVRKQIAMHLTRLGKDEGSFILSRVNGVVVDMYAILGEQFMKQLIANTTSGIAAAGGKHDKQTLQDVEKMLLETPTLLVFIMGGKIYQTEFIRRHATPTSSPVV